MISIYYFIDTIVLLRTVLMIVFFFFLKFCTPSLLCFFKVPLFPLQSFSVEAFPGCLVNLRLSIPI